jgi:hypothetical protein
VSIREVMAHRRYCLGRDYNIHLGSPCWLARVGLARFGNVTVLHPQALPKWQRDELGQRRWPMSAGTGGSPLPVLYADHVLVLTAHNTVKIISRSLY